jgi:hypothetical protein
VTVVGVEGRVRCKREEAKRVFLAYCVLVCNDIIIRICKRLTDIVYISKMGSCVPTNLIVVESMAGLEWYAA